MGAPRGTKMPNEAWVPIPGYEGIYEVSDLGRVRSVDRLDSSGHRRHGRPMNQSLVGCGYPRVTLTKNGLEKGRKVHQLVLAAFLGPPREGMVARHKNGNPRDNRLVNLCWGSPKENAADRLAHGRTYQGELHYNAKLTAVQVLEIRASKGLCGRELSAAYGVGTSQIYAIRSGLKWKHLNAEEEARAT